MNGRIEGGKDVEDRQALMVCRPNGGATGTLVVDICGDAMESSGFAVGKKYTL